MTMVKLKGFDATVGTMAAARKIKSLLLQSVIELGEIREGRYLVRRVQTREELDAVLKLRFEVFNLELGEVLASSFRTGRDLDEFDETCHHLIVIETEQNKIVGT